MAERMRLDGRTAVITGAAGGIGRAIAVSLARRGCHVALADVNVLARGGVKAGSIDSLEELLLEADFGVPVTLRLVDGEDVWVRGTFHDVRAPERVSFSESFTDASGRTIKRPGFPLSSLVTVTFTEHESGTLVTVEHAGVGEDRRQTWSDTLAHLAAHAVSTKIFTLTRHLIHLFYSAVCLTA